MGRTETPAEPAATESWRACDWAAAVFLFLATAFVVLWQNSRLGILWDLSYVLENSYRISRGDFPYRDFPFPYPPLTFLTQALLIKITGRVFVHHILYCAVVGGLGTVITWRIVCTIMRGALTSPRLIAFLLAVPLTVLGIYCVFPHPFYDPDCTLVVLLSVFLLQQAELKNFPPVRAFLTGAVLIVPLFIKQNTGLAFLANTAIGFAILIVFGAKRGHAASGYAWLMAGMAAGLGSAATLIHLTVGLRNYERWTFQFAAARRLPQFSEMLATYRNPTLLWWTGSFAVGIVLFQLGSHGKRTLLAVSLLSLPFAWTMVYLLVEQDPSERAERLLALWPFLLIISFASALWRFRSTSGIKRILPFILIGTVQGAFLSQQLWGSTYAIWPLLMILLADVLGTLFTPISERSTWEAGLFAGVVAVSMLVSGACYVASHERLDYADLSGGEIVRSTLQPLAGLSVRGLWIPQFEELVRFSERGIPRDQGMLMIPGEDLFYYTTGRRPRFPVLMFDHTVNPYSPEQIVELSRDRNICWLVLKKKLQLNDDPVQNKSQLLELLHEDFTEFKSLDNYDIYRRSSDSGCADDPRVSQGAN